MYGRSDLAADTTSDHSFENLFNRMHQNSIKKVTNQGESSVGVQVILKNTCSFNRGTRVAGVCDCLALEQQHIVKCDTMFPVNV